MNKITLSAREIEEVYQFFNNMNDLGQCISMMEDARNIDELDMNEYEQDAFKMLYKLSKSYIKHYERLSEEFLD